MTTEQALTIPESGYAIAEQVIIKGDLSRLPEEQRMAYYTEVCRSLGLNPLTRPFEYITLNGKLTLYATRVAADQLRSIRAITITGLDPRQVGDLYVVVATGRDRTGREDSSTGAVSTKGLNGEALANAMMKAETKAKRRLTLSLAGLGWSDETEVADLGVPVAPPAPRPSLAAVAAEKRAAVDRPTPAGLPPVDDDDDEPIEGSVRVVNGPGMTKAELVSALAEARIATDYAAARSREMFPSGNLSDEDRRALFDDLTTP